MADPQHQRDPEPLADDAVVGRDGVDVGMPRWVKLFLMVGLAIALLFVLAQVTGLAGGHGPGRHGPGRHGAGSDTRPSVVQEGGGYNASVVRHS